MEKNIPEQFLEVFETDWNKGNDSKLLAMERCRIHSLYLEYNKWSMFQEISEIRPLKMNQAMGFIDIDE